ncbi:hypothetical protein VIGAN_03254500, partial [Vigna angularis var. angularis]
SSSPLCTSLFLCRLPFGSRRQPHHHRHDSSIVLFQFLPLRAIQQIELSQPIYDSSSSHSTTTPQHRLLQVCGTLIKVCFIMPLELG